MAIKASEMLHEAILRICEESHWTTGVLARDREGAETAPESEFACSWSAEGALRKASNNAYSGCYGRALAEVEIATFMLTARRLSLQEVNDSPIWGRKAAIFVMRNAALHLRRHGM